TPTESPTTVHISTDLSSSPSSATATSSPTPTESPTTVPISTDLSSSPTHDHSDLFYNSHFPSNPQ
ncbi:G8 domain-containing protein DDB_G0286311-like, partial [Lynx rufus]|uniref:G8 domain-containing protein DDB_G0286311-like n=1 Tax=Lynx rufus TaxID=61384 RepID=UPI001F1232E7